MKWGEAKKRFEIGMARERKAQATRDTYLSHVKQFFRFQVDQDSAEFREFLHDYDFLETRISLYLSSLSHNRAAATQAQSLNAIVCFYRLIGRPIGELPVWVRPKEKIRVPVWVTTKEARAIIAHLKEPWDEVASMLIGSGLRITECLRLRMKDIDLERLTVTIHGGKGDKDRVVMLARSIVPLLERRMEISTSIWREDRAAKRQGVWIPDGLERKYPRGGEELGWFFLWPAPGESVDPQTKIRRRHHLCPEGFTKALKKATARAGVCKIVKAHTFRHGFATAYLMNGGTLPELQELMGHSNPDTTAIYTHCIPEIASRVSSPMDVSDEQQNTIRFRRTA